MSIPLGRLIFLTFVLNLFDNSYEQYVPPKPTVEPLTPKGIRISIPHEDGISLVAYHVKFNSDFYSLEAGTIAVDIIKPKDGRWTYEDHSTKLKVGDIVYLWVHVDYEGRGYNLLDQQHKVTDFYNYDGSAANKTDGGNGTCAAISETKAYTRDRETRELKSHNVCAGDIIFIENFDTLNTDRWKVIERFSMTPNSEFVVYLNHEDNVYVQDGLLYIKPVQVKDKYGIRFVEDGSLTLHKCTEQIGSEYCMRRAKGWDILPPVMSGRLNTKHSFNFMYGKIQVRAKLPRGDWIYPLIALESVDQPNSTIFSTIVIANSFGNPTLITTSGKDIGSHVLQAGAVVTTLGNGNIRDNRMDLPTKTLNVLWSEHYHVYEVEWRRERLVLKVDGQQYGEQRVPYLFDAPFYIDVGLGVGGYNIFPDRCRSGNYLKPWKNKGVKARYNFYISDSFWRPTWGHRDTVMAIDYIKVLAL
ncbi:beta-1,3-glucan-binding protein 1 [Megalopta genalis]|uniref:beta-1,3-glucan-binding protein 1 n=1 Tax=Megalopta genalis TaxID=115081 RepID=UPI003FCFFED7